MQENLLIVDDEPKIADTVRAYLVRAGYKVAYARDGFEAQRQLEQGPLALVILDLMVPGLCGEELCKRIRAGFYVGVPRDLPIIMLTAKADELSVVHGLNIGADDYVTKPFSPRELVARIQAILRRSTKIKPNEPLVFADLMLDREKRLVTRGSQPLVLTPIEYKILETLAGCPQKIFTRDEIIDAVQGADFNGFDRAIDSHIKNLRRKLGDNPRHPNYIETVYGMGYRLSNTSNSAPLGQPNSSPQLGQPNNSPSLGG